MMELQSHPSSSFHLNGGTSPLSRKSNNHLNGGPAPCLERRKFDHVSPALENLRWIPVKSHLYLRDAILAFKSITGQVPNYLSSNFISRGNISRRATRSSTQLNIPLFKTMSGQRSFYYRTVTLWNALKPHFKLREFHHF